MPIRLRLTLLSTVGAVLLLTAFGAFVHARLGQDLLDGVDLGLRARAADLAARIDVGAMPSLESAGELIDADESVAQLLDSRGRVLASSGAVGKGTTLVAAGDLTGITGPQFVTRTVTAVDADPLRLLAVPVDVASGHGFLVLGSTLGDRQDALEGLATALLIGVPLAAVLIGVTAWFVIGGALGPVERMRAEAAAISASEPERRLPVPATRDELAALGLSLNSMLDRLQAALERERRLVDDASHELRTPLANLKAELDLALRRARTQPELEAALRSAADESDRLSRLAADLLVLARAERGRLPVQAEDVDVAALAGEAVAAFAGRAAAEGVSLTSDVAGGTRARVDAARLRQALDNLLDNAIRSAPPGGLVTIVGDARGGELRVGVTDTGPGFRDDFLEAAFEPFSRADAGRSRNDGGAGLGLAIVRAIAESHGGSVVARNLPERGAMVELQLPAGPGAA